MQETQPAHIQFVEDVCIPTRAPCCEADSQTHEMLLEREAHFRSECIARISHELRTPLTAIKGFTDLILEGDAGAINDHVREFLELVKLSADQLTDLINGILDLSHGDTGSERESVLPDQ